MQSYKQIQEQHGKWSQENFGEQETPYFRVYAAGSIRPHTKRDKADYPGHESTIPRVVALNGLAPLMGLVEEVGELYGAACPADAKDAIGDIAVYLCDYLTRENLRWPDMALYIDPAPGLLPCMNRLVAAMGKLYHCHLKRFQRIRDMHDPLKFGQARWAAVEEFVYSLEGVAREHDPNGNLLMILNETWNKIVAKRDWKADASKGGGATHENIPAHVTLPADIQAPQPFPHHNEHSMEADRE